MARILASNVLIVLSLCCACVTAERIIFPDMASFSSCRTPDRQRGTCISILECDTITDYLKKLKIVKDADILKHVNPYKCGNVGKYPKVCCPSSEIPIPMAQTEDKLKLLPTDCGTTANIDKIVNGVNASLYEFPWMAALMYESRYGPEFQCGGSLINKRYVLTAAHCLKMANKRSQKKLVQVRLGEHNFDTVEDCDMHPLGNTCAPPVQDFDVSMEDTVIHPGYNPTTLANDIALIRLRREADLSTISVKPVCLPVLKTTKEKKLKKSLTVSGWGTTENNTYSPFLLKVVVSAVDNDKCSELYKGPIVITGDQLCAGGENSQNTCTGDSGGPLVHQVPLDGVLRIIQYGIVSAGPTLCEKRDFPVRYTRVTSYVDWILENIRS